MGRSGVPTRADDEMKMCRDYYLYRSARKVAKLHNVAPSTVISVVDRNPELMTKLRHEMSLYVEEGLSKAILEYCGSRGILDPEKIKNATLQQVGTSLAIAIDKLAIIQGAPQLRAPDDLPPVVRALADRLLRELYQQHVDAAPPAEVVE